MAVILPRILPSWPIIWTVLTGENIVCIILKEESHFTATLEYQDADVAPLIAEDQAVLYWWDGSGRQDASQTCPHPVMARDLVAKRITVSICQAGS